MGRDQSRTSDILEAVALLVVDMQETFLSTIPERDALVRRCAFAIETARTLGIRVLFTEQVPDKLGHTSPELRELAPDARVFSKNSFSCLAANGVAEHLRKAGVYHLLIAGIETPVCIYQTALHAQDSDFDVTLLSDCVGGRRAEDSRVVLQALAAASCHILPAETVFYSMLGNSGHRLFRDFTELVKNYSDTTATKPAKSKARKTRGKSAEATAKEPAKAKAVEIEEAVEAQTSAIPEQVAEMASMDELRGSDERVAASDLPDEAPEEREAGEPAATVEGEGTRKRSRRRRGGARRRRARERVANAVNNEHGSDSDVEASDCETSPPAEAESAEPQQRAESAAQPAESDTRTDG